MTALTLFSLAALAASPATPTPSPTSVAEAARPTEALVSAYMNKVARDNSLGVVAPVGSRFPASRGRRAWPAAPATPASRSSTPSAGCSS